MKDKIKLTVLGSMFLSIVITSWWTFIEFLIYLFKDISFNWYSLISFNISIVVIVLYIFILHKMSKQNKANQNSKVENNVEIKVKN